jgi:hypothetical protein
MDPITDSPAPEVSAEETPEITPEPAAPEISEAPKPSIFLDNEQAAGWGLDGCQVGDTYTGNVTLRVTGLNESEDGGSKTLEIVDTPKLQHGGGAEAAVDGEDDADESGEGALPEPTPEEAEEKMLGFKRPKKDKPFPPVTGLTDY